MINHEPYIHAVLEFNPTGMIIVEKDTRTISYVNDAAARMIGLPRESIKGRICHKFICPAEMNGCPVSDLGQTVDRSERFLLKSDGTKIPILKSVVSIVIDEKDYLLESFIDITDRRQAVEALIKSEEKFSKVFRANPVGIIITRQSDGLLIDTNEAFRKLLKYTQKDLVGKTVKDMNLWAVEEHRDQLLQQLEKGPVRDVEVRFRASDGREVVILYSAEALDIGGETCVLSLLVDVTKQKHVEEALRKSEKYFKALTESATDVLIIVDEANIIKYATPSAEWILGYRPDELLGRAAMDFVVPDDYSKAVEDFGRALLTKDIPIFNKLRIRRKDGTTSVMEGVGRNLLHDPVIAGVVMNIRDVTESYRATEALKESEKKFRSIVDNAFDCILIIDLDGTIRFVNNAALHTMKAESAGDLTGKNVVEFVAPESVEDIFRDFTEVAKGHDSYLARYYLINRRGEKICVESIGRLIDYEGRPATIVSIRDMTERIQAEEEKAKLQSQLLQAQKMESIGRLAGGVAHDFNNMLGVMRGYTEIAMTRLEKDHPVRASLLQVMEAAERSANLTRQLLAFARQQTIAPRVMELNDVVAGMLKLLKRLIGEDMILAWLPGGNVWPVKIDPSQIDQILANLCVNARDAIDNVGQVTIETKNVQIGENYCTDQPGCTPGDYVLLSVSDTGCGMDKETQAKIFEPFFTTKAVGKGTGLGLATVYGIVQQNKGFINVYSEPGMGTTFRIYIPSYREQIISDRDHEASRTAAGGHETILVVEDEPSLLDLTRMMLEIKGYRVLTAGSPEQAIRMAKEQAGGMDLLLTDVVMPGMNGRDLAQEIRAIFPGIKSLFMSGYTADVIAHHGVLEEGVHFIQKPMTVESLAAKVREVLDKP